MKKSSIILSLTFAGLCVGCGMVKAEKQKSAFKKSDSEVKQEPKKEEVLVPSMSGSHKSTRIISIDSIRMLRESKEGKKLEAEIQHQVKEFEDSIHKANNELMSEQESLSKQSSLLSKDALQEKADSLMRLKKEKQRHIEEKREELSESIQRRQIKLREKQLADAREALLKQGADLIVEQNTPFLLGVAPSINKTDEAIKIVNAKFESSPKAKGSSTVEKVASYHEEKAESYAPEVTLV